MPNLLGYFGVCVMECCPPIWPPEVPPADCPACDGTAPRGWTATIANQTPTVDNPVLTSMNGTYPLTGAWPCRYGYGNLCFPVTTADGPTNGMYPFECGEFAGGSEPVACCAMGVVSCLSAEGSQTKCFVLEFWTWSAGDGEEDLSGAVLEVRCMTGRLLTRFSVTTDAGDKLDCTTVIVLDEEDLGYGYTLGTATMTPTTFNQFDPDGYTVTELDGSCVEGDEAYITFPVGAEAQYWSSDGYPSYTACDGCCPNQVVALVTGLTGDTVDLAGYVVMDRVAGSELWTLTSAALLGDCDVYYSFGLSTNLIDPKQDVTARFQISVHRDTGLGVSLLDILWSEDDLPFSCMTMTFYQSLDDPPILEAYNYGGGVSHSTRAWNDGCEYYDCDGGTFEATHSAGAAVGIGVYGTCGRLP